MLRPIRTLRSLAIAAGCAALTASSLGAPTTRTAAAQAPGSLDAEPIARAAAYIGVPTSALAADIVAATTPTGISGMQVAVDQLDAAMTRHLASFALVIDENTVLAHHAAAAEIRDALLDQAVTVLQSALRG